MSKEKVETAIRDFTQGSISKQLLQFALPLFLSNLLQVVYNMVDMVIVGNRLGKVGISALFCAEWEMPSILSYLLV